MDRIFAFVIGVAVSTFVFAGVLMMEKVDDKVTVFLGIMAAILIIIGLAANAYYDEQKMKAWRGE